MEFNIQRLKSRQVSWKNENFNTLLCLRIIPKYRIDISENCLFIFRPICRLVCTSYVQTNSIAWPHSHAMSRT